MEFQAFKKKSLISVPCEDKIYTIVDQYDLFSKRVGGTYTWYVVKENSFFRLVYPSFKKESVIYFNESVARCIQHDKELLLSEIENAKNEPTKDTFLYIYNKYFCEKITCVEDSIVEVREALWFFLKNCKNRYSRCQAECFPLYKSFSTSSSKEDFCTPQGLSIKLLIDKKEQTFYFFMGPHDEQIDEFSWSTPNIYQKALKTIERWRLENSIFDSMYYTKHRDEFQENYSEKHIE